MKREDPRPRARASLKDVAAALGVSPATISNAYNRPHHLSAELREKVFETARQLGYPGPNPIARSLRLGQAGAVGVLYPEQLPLAFSDEVTAQFLRGVTAATEAAGLGLLLIPAPLSNQSEMSTVQKASVDGLILYSISENDARLEAAKARHVPIIVVDQPRQANLPFVGIEDQKAAREAAQHVRELGHQHVGILGFKLAPQTEVGWFSPQAPLAGTYPISKARLQGYLEGLFPEGHIQRDQIPIYMCGSNHPTSGLEAAHQLLDQHPETTALLAMNDRLAFGALMAARERGLRVPEDLSVVGFDDGEQAQQWDLTTIHQSSEEKGRCAGEALILALQGKTPPLEQILPTHLKVRKTSGPPRGN